MTKKQAKAARLTKADNIKRQATASAPAASSTRPKTTAQYLSSIYDFADQLIKGQTAVVQQVNSVDAKVSTQSAAGGFSLDSIGGWPVILIGGVAAWYFLRK